uniref:Thioredoxin n=1 Tax=Candidatus Aschnera chinzeii TaxID=1485666 RepID=A0AAT9G522_9ENTR|nr:MAG: thioredoxin TrxA [Candidatus Aschnera chinzeii]
MTNTIIELTDENFQTKITEAHYPVLIDFWAEWCSPCKMIATILDELLEEYTHKLIIAKLNIDQNPQTTNQYNIRSIPTLILLKSGNLIDKKIGLLSKEELQNFIDQNI